MSNKEEKVYLSDKDHTVLHTEGEMLNDNHITKFEKLLRRESNLAFNMQSTLYLITPEFIIPIDKNQKHIQILFSGACKSGQWICTYYDGLRLYIYNSLNKGYLNEDQKKYLLRLYPFKPPVVFSTVNLQPNGIDCGIYAIAFATSLYYNELPNTVNYIHSEIRRHLIFMFENNRLISFPSVELTNVIRPFFVEYDWKCLLTDGATKLIEIPNLSSICETSISISNNNVNRGISTEYSEEKLNKNENDEKKRHRAIKDKERKREERLKETDEQKIIRLENDRLRKQIENETKDPQNLSDEDYKILNTEGKKLNDNHITEFEKLLRKESDKDKDKERKRKASSCAFASMGAKLEVPKGYGPYVFRIHGQVYHNTYTLHPDDGDNRKYGQLYILDTDEAVMERLNNECNKKCLQLLMTEIDILLGDINIYAKSFKMMKEFELEEEARAKLMNECPRSIQMWFKRDRKFSQSKYNVPSCNEVAVIFVSENGEPPIERDICIHPRGSKSIPISSLSTHADPMTYPLMFPSGDPGWTVNMKHTDGKKLQAEMYCGLMDYINNKATEENIRPGKMIILPSTFTGGPRAYQQCFMDAMRLVQEFGKPDLFITMTCNPKWPEIMENLLDSETASDRPDIVARVFQKKVKELMCELKDKQIFGPVIAYVYVIEFQKRGLPHVHSIIFLDKKFAIRDAETADKIICAEIPDEKKNPELYKIVKQFQVHGPCGKQNGHDYAIVGYKDDNQVIHYDEIQNYLNTRYVCPPEAMHRLYEFNMHEQSHATYRLAVHLPNQQSICFQEGMEQTAIEKFKNTMLTAWFQLNRQDPEARKYLYSEIPHKYVFVESTKTWKKRERITKPIICRMYFVSPKDIERYFLRILLLYVRGAKSFEDVRTYEGITYNTYIEAARARNLMVDDNEWDNCLTEAVSMKFPKELCRLFAYICVFGLPVNAVDLWNKFKEHMVFDNNLPVEISLQKSLLLINEVFNFHGFTLHQFGLPNIDLKILEDYSSVDKEDNALTLQLLKEEANNLIESLNDEQRQVFNDVMTAVHNDEYDSRYFFLDGPGGSGKSYLHNTIITTVESEEIVVLSVAWTGIAANLLKGGRTSHSMFKFPIPINEDSTCNISGMSKHAELLKSAKIIIWDEISMTPKYALQAMESMLRDITKCNKPFGGKVILLSGDFRQTLPIVPHGSRTHIVEVCVKNSKLWQYFETRSLNVNVRLHDNQVEFSNWLLNVGDGKPQSTFEKENDVLEIPQDLISNGNLIDEIYGSSINPNDVNVYSSCILSLTNSEVLDMNDRILSKLEGEEVIYYSVDSHIADDDEKNAREAVPMPLLSVLVVTREVKRANDGQIHQEDIEEEV
ncbi:uncharacterized protein LOC122510603 [Leptopilina heterotoma]|uniref:uncharacterized protein LOC122510603 n=1 Tax=Leptopilina heterotoma TaxID=63436 RepID=UPI001CAA3E3E|nr:uncharacterized protein LOC122510603 [Leptopilina heterotoma]